MDLVGGQATRGVDMSQAGDGNVLEQHGGQPYGEKSGSD
jgi:hypothetical protein